MTIKPEPRLYLRFEMITTFLWFGLDSAWLFEWRFAAHLLAAAAVLGSLLTTLYAERDPANLIVAGGIVGWVLMNACWVTGDLDGIPSLVTAAKACAGFVIVCLLLAAGATRGRQVLAETLQRFRRIRFN